MILLAILFVCCTAVFHLAYACTHSQCSAEELPSRADGGNGVLLQTRHSKTSTSNVQPQIADTQESFTFLNASAPTESSLRNGSGQAYHAMARNGCKGTGALFIHFGLGSHGGESLHQYFYDENFSTLFWRPLPSMLIHDLRAGDDHLPSIQRAVAEAKQENACGNVFLGDIKPQLVRAWANITYEQLFRSLEMTFPDAVWVWLIRHPDTWATSLTHFFPSLTPNRKEAYQSLQKWRRTHALFHCRAWQHFGSRLQSNGKGDVVQLNLEQLDWPLFVKQLQDASGYHGLSSENGMPHVNHHEPSWTFPVPDTTNWNSSKYLTEACELVAGDEA